MVYPLCEQVLILMQQLDESLGSKGMNRMKGGECRVVHHSDRAIDQAEQDVASYEEIEEPKNFYGKSSPE